MANRIRQSQSVSSLAQDILAFMQSPPPHERICAREDLAHFGDTVLVDAALLVLERDHHIGSPARGYWMPLAKWTNNQGQTELAPPAFLPELLRTLWSRKGFKVYDSSHRFLQEHGTEAGQWAVPAYENVGIEAECRPEPLTLRWRNGMARTVWHRQVLEDPVSHNTATAIDDSTGQGGRAFPVWPCIRDRNISQSPGCTIRLSRPAGSGFRDAVGAGLLSGT